ncbi:efflux RND transporter periplasmic adaptor subunit [Pseudomarimonas arenosa]|uniref:Efflux RND transporter periplasmic adaptor subunit n=1 Tax=Pseudomarimonas arenosa TaxID=2774145 RepID=A0AAW3ZEW0_9GAMM|nr:efflux RND transporter periplasmic adaptor subunit [Pseudomarimonas arenosa]MBD8524641.1 efflux RND transporter periplasmic adaptor subunit [Pseudomarimonas arenosa]
MNIPFARRLAALLALALIGLASYSPSRSYGLERSDHALEAPAADIHAEDHHSASTLALPAKPNSLYVCPMHPQIRSNAPGGCPICGMQLVRRATDASGGEAPVIQVDGDLRQALGIRSAPVQRHSLSPRVSAPAEVMLDQDRIRHVHARVSGWVEVLHIHALGESVQPGQVLMELYAPDLVAAQEDYLIALRTGGTGSRAQRAAATRLRVLGVDEAFIDALAERGSSALRVPVRAQTGGVVTMLEVRHGMYVTPSTTMLEIASLDSVWVRVDVLPEELERLGVGKIYAALRAVGVTDRVWRGEVSYIYPSLDTTARTVQLRVTVPNRRGLLRVGQLMQASLRGENREPRLAVPSEAVIRTADGERVMLDLGDGRFRPQPVQAGLRAEGYTEILQGLDEGQQVVISAQFLLDSESALRAGQQRLGGGHAH